MSHSYNQDLTKKRGIGGYAERVASDTETVVAYDPELVSDKVGRVNLKDSVEQFATPLLSQGWAFKQIAEYTEADPFTVTQGNKLKLTFQADDPGMMDGRNLTLDYDFVDQKFVNNRLGNAYIVELRFKIRNSTGTSRSVISLESPGASFNPIQAVTLEASFTGYGTPKFQSLTRTVYIGQEIVNNGVEIYVEALSGDTFLHDVSIFIGRIYNVIE